MLLLDKVLHILDLGKKLISLGALQEQGVMYQSQTNGLTVQMPSGGMLYATMRGHLYYVNEGRRDLNMVYTVMGASL